MRNGGGARRSAPSTASRHPQSPPYRLESVCQLPPTVSALSRRQLVPLPANSSLFFFFWGKLSQRVKDHEIWGNLDQP